MKKLLINVVTFLLILVFAFPASSEIVYDDTEIYSTCYASEYAKIIESIIKNYGVSEKSKYNDNNTNGFVHARLIDFEGDLVPELYVLYKKDAEHTTQKDVYVETIWQFKYGEAKEVYYDSNDFTADYMGLLFIPSGDKVYMLRENGLDFEEYTFANAVENYYHNYFLMGFSGGNLYNLVEARFTSAYTENREIFRTRNYNEENGYDILSYETTKGKVYIANRFEITENNEKKTVSQNEFYNTPIFGNYVDITLGSDYETFGQRFMYYTEYGTYPDKDLEYNSEEILNTLKQIALALRPDVTVVLDDVTLEFDTKPLIYNSRTLVPLRVIFEALGAQIYWDDATKTVTATKDDKEVIVPVNKNVIYINGVPQELDVAAKIVSDRTLVPVRAVTESFDCTVSWDDATKTVYIKTTEFDIVQDDEPATNEEL